jgi:hypothetical protein
MPLLYPHHVVFRVNQNVDDAGYRYTSRGHLHPSTRLWSTHFTQKCGVACDGTASGLCSESQHRQSLSGFGMWRAASRDPTVELGLVK